MIIWKPTFINSSSVGDGKRALVILNQAFSASLFERVWNSCEWRCCADGGANRLYDIFESPNFAHSRDLYIPDLIKGDMDSIRPSVREYYEARGVEVVEDHDQDSTDLMKCIDSLAEKEKRDGDTYEVLVLGGLSGRLDQTVHLLHYFHKSRRTRPHMFVVTDDSIGWVLDEGEHLIHVDHSCLGPTCGLLPVGVESAVLSTTGLRWNLDNCLSSFNGLVSTSNHLVPDEPTVWVKTSKPIWWCVELRRFDSFQQ